MADKTIAESILQASNLILAKTKQAIDDVVAHGVEVDDALSSTSENPVQNKKVKEALDTKASASDLTNLTTRVSTSENNISSIQSNITTIQNDIGGINTTLSGKQNTLTFDSSPTVGSTNPVTSEGIKNYVDNNVPSIIEGDGIDVSVSGTDTTVACDFGDVNVANTTKPVTGAAIKTAIDDAIPNITAGGGINVQSSSSSLIINGNYTAETPLTVTNGTGTTKVIAANFDTAPTTSSTNLVNSGAIKTAIDNAASGLQNAIDAITLTAGDGIDITNKVISAVLPTSDPGVDNVLWIEV